MGEECVGGKCDLSGGSCGDSCGGSCGCGGNSCGSSCGDSCDGCGCSWGCPDPADMAQYVALKAMKELLKEHVKKKMEAAMGKKLDKMADIILEGFASHMEDHKTMNESMEKRQAWMNKLMEAMNE